MRLNGAAPVFAALWFAIALSAPAASAQRVEHDDGAAAPTDPEPLRLALDLTQVAGGKEPFLCFILSIRNETRATIRYKAGELALQVAGRRIRTSRLAAKRGSVAIEAGMHADAPVDTLRLLSDCDIEPLHTVTGWMCFDLKDFMPVPDGADDFAAHESSLVGRVGEYVVKFDVAAHEIETLGIVTRPSRIEGAVHVIEIGRRINALNVGRLLAAIDSIPAEERGYILYVREPRLLLDSVAGEALRQKTGGGRWGAVRFGGGEDAPDVPKPVVVRANADFPRRTYALDQLSQATSEAVAALRVVSEQSNTGAVLVGYLTDASSEIRTEAAQDLAKHVDEPGVSAALMRATRDSDPEVRIAALWSLAPWQAADDNSPEVAAVVKAMHDSNAGVRIKAAEGASWAESERVKQELLRLLDDEAPGARFHACHSLRLLKYRPAIPKLKELMNSRDSMLSGAAIDALIEIGELSRFDGAFAKIERQDPSVFDVDAIAQADDPRVVPALIGLLAPNKYGHSSDTVISHAARALGDRQAKEAVEPLLAALAETDFPMEWMPIVAALGKLGDARAIAPIRKAMRRHPKLDDGLVGYEALLSLNAPGVFDELLDLLKQQTTPAALGPVLEVFARHSDERMVPIIEPYLDREDACSVAAKAMTYVRSPAALAALERRLNSADYALGRQLLAGVWRNAEWFGGADGRAVLEAARRSPNEATRAAVTELPNIEPRQPFRPPPRRGRRRR